MAWMTSKKPSGVSSVGGTMENPTQFAAPRVGRVTPRATISKNTTRFTTAPSTFRGIARRGRRAKRS